jgi:hypothetical protein
MFEAGMTFYCELGLQTCIELVQTACAKNWLATEQLSDKTLSGFLSQFVYAKVLLLIVFFCPICFCCLLLLLLFLFVLA